MPQYHNLLRNYVREYAIPGMLKQGWAFKAAKSYGWLYAARGGEFHVDQPLRTHILNGLYAITRVLEYLDVHGYFHMGERDFKRVLVLYTLHDTYKDPDVAGHTAGASTFDVELQKLEPIYRSMRLDQFIALKAEDIRIASVSRLSHKVADLSYCSPDAAHLLNFIHLADALASQQHARDYKTAENYLREVSCGDAVLARQATRMSKRLGMELEAPPVKPALKIYYHELDDYRGVSTLMIHQGVEEHLLPFGLYPVVYFPNGTLYLGPENIEPDIKKLYTDIVERLFDKIRSEAKTERLGIAREACDVRKGMKIEKYAYLFCTSSDLLTAVQEKSSLSNIVGFLRKRILPKRVETKKYSQVDDFYALYGIPVDTDSDEGKAQRWFAASKLVMAAESIASALVTEDTLEWLYKLFSTPADIVSTIRQTSKTLRDGGVSDHCYVIAYHWLAQAHFTSLRRTWLEFDVTGIQQTLIQHISYALKTYENGESLLAFVEKELGFRSDALTYLHASLTFSFHAERTLEESPLQEYEKERKQAHKRLCALCNRLISPAISKKNREIKTTVASQQAQVFSNRRLPTQEIKNDMMVWCPMCYLEFMLRKLSGQSYPEGSDYNASYRLHLYLLPDYSFTPQLWEDAGKELLSNFQPEETYVSRLALRGGKDDPALPTRWLTGHGIDQAWLEQVQQMFTNQAARMKLPTKDGKKRRYGDRLTFSFKQPNYVLITYDNVVARSADKSLIPTHVEVWTKALYTAVLLHLLTGVRVYITDKPYLSLTRPEQMKTVIEMEGLHPLLQSLLPQRRTEDEFVQSGVRASESSARVPLSALPVLLDLLSAVWEINAALYQSRPNERRNLDKQVATTLEEVRTNYLAGATLYKAREREKDAYAVFTHACRLLLPQQSDQGDESRQILYREGYELLFDKEGWDVMQLAQQITEASLMLYIPSTKKTGRAHRFENLFRTGVDAIKSSAHVKDEGELIARVSGTVLKRLERISENKGFCPVYGEKRLEVVQHFAELLVRDLFYQRCGMSISKLTHEENHLADAIYFLTYQRVIQYWENKKRASNSPESEEPDEEV